RRNHRGAPDPVDGRFLRRDPSRCSRLRRPAERLNYHGAMDGAIACIYRDESRRVLATLIRVLGDFELAEEALHDAFAAAVEQWPRDGVPDNPRAWLVSTGRFKAIDAVRRRARFEHALA